MLNLHQLIDCKAQLDINKLNSHGSNDASHIREDTGVNKMVMAGRL